MKKTAFYRFLCLWSIILISSLSAQVVINEVCPANLSGPRDEFGERDDWIELYNAGNRSVELAGWWISDNPKSPRKHRLDGLILPPHSRLLLWADGQPEQGPAHLSFKLARSGEQLVLTSTEGIAAQFSYSELPPDQSYGRSPDGEDRLLIFPTPTPGLPNPSIDQLLKKPYILPQGGVFSEPQWIRMSSEDANAELYFTLDGSPPDPTRNSNAVQRYTVPFLLDSLAVVQVRAFRNGCPPSETASAVLLIQPPHLLPILLLQADPADLFDERYGIYAHGDSSGSRWERPTAVHFFVDGRREFSVQAGLRIQGNTGRQMPKKSFRLHFRNRYGAERLYFPLFENAVESYSSLVLRAGYDDDLQKETGTLLRDPIVNELYRRLGLPTSHGLFCVLYLNHQFWGIYELREDIQTDFVRAYFGISDPDIIRLRWGYNNWEVDAGDAVEWQNLLDFFRSGSFEEDHAFAELARRIDVEAMTLLQALVHATQYRSWTYGAFFFRDRRTDGPWRFTIWDMDRSLSSLAWNGFSYYAQPTGEYWIHFIVQKMLENVTYRRRFLNHLADLLNSRFHPQQTQALLDSLAAAIEPEIPFEQRRWTPGEDRWRENVERLRGFLGARPDTVLQQAARFFRIRPAVTIHIDVDSSRGRVRLNTLLIDGQFSGRYFPDVPIELTALPNDSFAFVGWNDPSLPESASIALTPTENMKLSPIFKRRNGFNTGDTLKSLTFSLAPNVPNPFNRSTNVRFTLPAAGRVRLSLFDLKGRLTAVLLESDLPAGAHEFTWEAESQAAGVYLLCLESGGGRRVRKIT
ncbi:MAG: CotH kinase family protein, partial [candidate division KSB1 bacterium]|nr:CotH kinase family protein [candidate division KSB1 bacterium]